jgi:hypothetical protein
MSSELDPKKALANGSLYISKLFEYSQKTLIDPPVFNYTSPEPQIFNCTLTIESHEFVANGYKSKSDAKKVAATLAFDHYCKLGNSFFTNEDTIAASVISKLHELCASLDIPNPYYNMIATMKNDLGISFTLFTFIRYFFEYLFK